MRNIALLTLGLAVVLAVSGCGASKKAVEQNASPVTTYVLPGSDLVSGDGLIRGWGMGKSDNEASAHKKAVINASAALASALNQTVESTTEEYMAVLTDGDAAASKSLMQNHVKTVVNQALSGATIIYDRWADDPKDGLKTNYVVMELKGEEFLQMLYKEMEEENITVKKNLLDELFMRKIDQALRAQ